MHLFRGEPMRLKSVRLEPPTLEGEMEKTVRNSIHDYAPPSHPNRIGATAQVMCDGIDKLFAGASDENQKIVDQCEAALNEMKRFKTLVDQGMREAADGMKKHICHVTSLLEDATAKMQQNPFNGDAIASLPAQLHEESSTPQA